MATVTDTGTIRVEGNESEASSRSRVSLVEVEPDLARWLSVEQRTAAQQFLLPVETVKEDGDVSALLERSGAFGVLIFDGIVLQAVQLGERATLRLLGPGAIVPIPTPARPLPLGSASLVVPGRARLALLGREFLLAAHRWPSLLACLHARMLEQSEMLAVQLAISQLPRVEDRVMAIMWLLADSWGRVTPAGIRLPLSLSHETLGGLVGAQRPTVTLALTELAERGSLIKQGGGWLILKRPPARASAKLLAPQLSLAGSASSPSASSRRPEQPISESQLRGEQIARVGECQRLARRLIDQATDLCEHSQTLRDAGTKRRRVHRAHRRPRRPGAGRTLHST